ncbi:hypothetical protein AB0H51_29565 [Streptomyces griseoluteus]|uniref:hypothetical protein n=1 Tax=Streptomyces griseoluteus TaxID=29306 RepID=UPI0033E62036
MRRWPPGRPAASATGGYAFCLPLRTQRGRDPCDKCYEPTSGTYTEPQPKHLLPA